MWFIKIKKKKVQYLLLAIIFTITVTLISTCAVFTVASNTFAQKFYSGDDTADITVKTMSKGVIDKVTDWYNDQGSEVRNLREQSIYSISNNFIINDKLSNLALGNIIPINKKTDLNSKISVIEGDKISIAPKLGDIWIPNSLSKDKNIKVGDELSVKDAKNQDIKFIVGAIINDSNQPSSMLSTNFMYVNRDEASSLDGLPKGYLISFNCNGDIKEKNKEIIKYINGPLNGFIINKNTLIMAATFTSNIMGGIGLLSCVLIMIVLIIILRSNLWNNILKEYKSVGIYKAMGFSTRKIKSIYLKSYGAVALVASFIGCVASIPIINYICNIIFKYLGEYHFDFNSFLILVVIFITFNLLVVISLMSVLRRIKKIKPVEAINIGITSSKAKLKKSVIKNNSSSFAMAINDIFKYKKSNFIMFIIFAVVFYIIVFFLNMEYSIANMSSNVHNWIGTPKCDMTITGPIDLDNSLKDVIEYLNTNKKIKNSIYWDYYNSKSINIDNSKYNIDNSLVVITLHNEYDEEHFCITKGRNPREKDEVALSGGIMKNNNFHIGDYMIINIGGKDKKFLITGEYQSMQGNRQNMRLKTEAVHNEISGNYGFIDLKDKKDYEGLKRELEEKFKGIKVDEKFTADTFTQIQEIIEPVLIILIIGIALFSVVNVVNMILINNIDNRKNYGIMKAMGFSTKYIRNRTLIRIMILSITGAGLGISLNILTDRQLVMIAIKGMDGYMGSPSSNLIVVAALLGLIALTVVICCRSIKKISPVELIIE